MTQPAGWYGDPQDPSQQRYWDGAFWTEHRRPAAMPPPYGYGYGHQPMVPSTPDGVPLSGWWKRVGARILDGLIVGFGSLPLAGYFIYRMFQEMFADLERQLDSAGTGSAPMAGQYSWDVYKWMIPAQIIGLAASLAYEYFFLTRRGATPGKMALGIGVRLRDVPGPPPGTAVLKRWGFVSAIGMGGLIPLIGSLVGLAALLNYLWPMWDKNKQALHDKIAETNVVVTQS